MSARERVPGPLGARRPLCFILMPFHTAADSDGQRIDFSRVWSELIRPAVADAGMEPLRADEDPGTGIFQKRMFEWLVTCEFAVADLSTGNPNVYYELGVRHGRRPHSTVLMFRQGWRLPLDVAHSTAMEYPVDPSGAPLDVDRVRAQLLKRLNHARNAAIDSPVFQLVSGLPVPEVDHARIDSFRGHADRDEEISRRLESAADEGVEAVREVEADMGYARDLDASAALSLITAYRSMSAWHEIVRLVSALPRPIQRLELFRQQLAMALNRAGQGSEAERIGKALVAERASSESYGLLGRVYKDRWIAATSPARKRGFLGKAIDTYLAGFQADPRDAYPGVNAVTLMALRDPPDSRLPELLPVVRFVVDRELVRAEPDYWAHASDLGVAVLENRRDRANEALECALAAIRDDFEPETTARDLRLLLATQRERGEDVDWLKAVVDELEAARRE